MKPYLFIYEVKPKPDNPQTPGIGGANATIIVFSNSQETAERTCQNYISEYGWNSGTVEHAFELQPEQFPEWHVVIQSVYRKAELAGISAQFDAWPEKARPGVYAFETLQMPHKGKN